MLNKKVRKIVIIVMLVAIVAALVLSGVLPFLLS
ncbi:MULTISPECIES: stressosome-associated protein Prli42 [Mammaliicoccus]|uniref:Stressosome-associated protein Prli42 n=1 Tax=Mammaliicoccus fleurettii TaxID=150056 RepID=A0ABS5MKD7_9STAP|nr:MULTISPECIES: stressosome-associated protein Prli42 [Mammaliicoccus]MBL0846163.1 stressosome-associated protein Prli42 [Mammaliicoccus fleurettii]MBO3062474.1 stressosome-associated protein Prli42 [Mammaliicoccus fleurettii]MBS3671236.1 stressosome-associated protein Prli42 [Mammaliicoccus fleurettii]MBS3696390.1 stressosome-associated protein Prli42 [Mammaliicoccus fleurettii]MBW0764070.1 stressosome-associated protein Prli42 [Mammaliicoccus fleurettii]